MYIDTIVFVLGLLSVAGDTQPLIDVHQETCGVLAMRENMIHRFGLFDNAFR